MSQSPKEKTTDVETLEHRQERERNRRVFFDRFRRAVKFLLVMAILVIAFMHRVTIEKFCSAAFDNAMSHFAFSPQVRQNTTNYQNQLDDATTN